MSGHRSRTAAAWRRSRFAPRVVGACALLRLRAATPRPAGGRRSRRAPTDYRLRHPITISEADHTLEIFVGSNRGELNATPARRGAGICSDLEARSHRRRRGRTAGRHQQRACGGGGRARRSARILAATGVPPNGIVVRGYQPPNRNLATIRITYPRIGAQAGPCGLWPADIGPSFNRRPFREPAVVECGLRDAAQPRRHGGQPGRSGAAARRDAGLHDAPHHGGREVPRVGSPTADARSERSMQPRSATLANDASLS